jgi:hypothetical protein
MKQVFTVLFIIISYILVFKLGLWLGIEKAEIELRYNAPISLETATSGDPYTKYMLKNCLVNSIKGER